MSSDGTTQLIQTLTYILIPIIIAIFALIGFFTYLYFKEKNSKKEKQDSTVENTKKPQQDKQSIFNFMEFDTVRDNMIIQRKGKRYLMVIECQGINYDLMSEMEMASVEQGFIEFLNTLKFDIQIYVQTRTVNLESSLREYKLKFRDIEDKYNILQNKYMQLKSAESGMYTDKEIYDAYVEYVKQKNKYEYTKDIIANTEKSSLNSSVLHKKYYIIISCYEEEINTQNYSRDEIQSMIFSELYTRARSIMRTLSRCEVNSKILDSKGLVELLYNAYNREDSDIFSAQTAINAGFDSLYSTAPDVIDKKMKLINKQIEENGTKLANEAVMEAKSDKEMMLRIREENAKNLIFDFAEQLISENEEYLGKDISEDAKVKVRRKKKEATEGGNENETNEKTKATRGRRPSSGNE